MFGSACVHLGDGFYANENIPAMRGASSPVHCAILRFVTSV